MTHVDYKELGYDGWGHPTRFTPAQAREFSDRVKVQGKCGCVRATFYGHAVCTKDAMHGTEEADEDTPQHRDGRLQVVWSDCTEVAP